MHLLIIWLKRVNFIDFSHHWFDMLGLNFITEQKPNK